MSLLTAEIAEHAERSGAIRPHRRIFDLFLNCLKAIRFGHDPVTADVTEEHGAW
jgi:hypothetical protein